MSGIEGSGAPEKKKKTTNTAFPILPSAHNFSALQNPERFQAYIDNQLPCAEAGSIAGLPPPSEIPSSEKRADKNANKVNSTFVRGLLQNAFKQSTYSVVWLEKTVFPDRVLPIPFNEDGALSNTSLCIPGPSPALHLPKEASELDVQNWLNNMANNLALVHGLSLPNEAVHRSDRCFDCRTATRAAVGSIANFKPDICLIKRKDQHEPKKTREERLHWRNIYAFVEVTTSNTSRLCNILRQIQQKAMCLFDVQPQRRFLCALGIFGVPPNIAFTFVVVDRSGLLYTKPAVQHSYNAGFFMRIIFAFCFAKPEVFGWDPSVKLNPETNEVVSIDVQGFFEDSQVITTRTFDVVRLLHNSPILYSRGTRVWIVKDEEGRFFVLKDSWILEGRATSEIEFVRHIDRVIREDPAGYLFKYSCPSYCIGQEEVWSTHKIRGHLAKAPNRIQRRIVTGPIGDPITSFRSKKELVSVLIDIVNALEFLYEKVGVIHGDISMSNFMIHRPWDYGPNDVPSLLRIIACARAQHGMRRPNICNDSDRHSATPSSAASTSTTAISASATVTTSIIPASTTSTAQVSTTSVPTAVSSTATAGTSISVVQGPTVSEPATITQEPITPTFIGPLPATTAAAAATSAIQQSDQVPTAESVPVNPSPPMARPHAPRVGPVVDYAGTTEHIESAGMIIDCDFMRYEGQEVNLTSGTLPFMSIESLIKHSTSSEYKHQPGHDLESLLYTILTICHYTIGPGGQLRKSKSELNAVKLNAWFTTSDRQELADAKNAALLSFDTYIKTGLPPYWIDFAPFLQSLIDVTWDPKSRTLLETPNIATHAAYRDVLLKALAFYEKEEKELPAPYAAFPRGKRSRTVQHSLPPRSKRPRVVDDAGPTSSEDILPRPSFAQNLEDYLPSTEADSLESI